MLHSGVKTLVRAAAVTGLVLGAGAAFAEDEKQLGWSGNAALGYLSASGNADNLNVNGNLGLAYNQEFWTHTLNLAAIGAKADGIGSAERYTFGLKTQRDFTEFNYAFGRLDYVKDRFAGVAEQFSQTVGVGRRFINTDTHILNGEVGVGFRQLTFADTVDANGVITAVGEDESSAIVRVGGDYRWNFSETAHFDQTLAMEIGSDNTNTIAVSAVTAKLFGAMNLVVSLTINNNSDAPAGTTSTDRFTAISLEYAW
ncbi:MAG: DUF481 domain-containing protein [Pseudomonadota bacterium]